MSGNCARLPVVLAVAAWALAVAADPYNAQRRSAAASDLTAIKLGALLDVVQRLDTRLSHQNTVQYNIEAVMHRLDSLEASVSAELTELKAELARATEHHDAASQTYVNKATAILTASHAEVQQACSSTNGQAAVIAAVEAAVADLSSKQQQQQNWTRHECSDSIASLLPSLELLLKSDSYQRHIAIEQHAQLSEQVSGQLQIIERRLDVVTQQLQQQQQFLAMQLATTTAAPTSPPPPTVDPYRRLLSELYSSLQDQHAEPPALEDSVAVQ